MKLISLHGGLFAKVDDEDFDHLNQFSWHATKEKGGRISYARRTSRETGVKRNFFMHREIMKFPNGHVDHIDNDGLNNQKANLRIASRTQNQGNRRKNLKGTSKYKGVYWWSTRNKWRAQIKVNGKNKHIGVFEVEIDAAHAYDNKAKEYFGEFAKTNF